MRYWYVVVDDTPIFPEKPLNWQQATVLFNHEVQNDTQNEYKIEIHACTREDLDWAGIEGEAWDDDPEQLHRDTDV